MRPRRVIQTNQGTRICKIGCRFRKSNFCGRWSHSSGHQAHDNGAPKSLILRIFSRAFVPDVRITTSKFCIFQKPLSVFRISSNYMLAQFRTHFELRKPNFSEFSRAPLDFRLCPKQRKNRKYAQISKDYRI